MAKDSSSVSELYNIAAYEGHPLLWNFLLFIITRFSSAVIYMQLLNISILSVCVYLFVKHSPFKEIISVLIVFGYFFIYEYHVLSRNYAISLLCLTIVLIQLNKIRKNHLLIAAGLLLLAFTHAYSIILTIALSVLLISVTKERRIKYLYSVIIIICLLLFFSLNVPADHFLFKYDTEPLLIFKRIGKVVPVFLKGFLPIPDLLSSKAWNSNLLISLSKPTGALFSLALMLIPYLIFKRSPLVLFFFYFSSLCICLFIYLSPLIVSVRYCGFIFMIFIFSFWVQNIFYPNNKLKSSAFEKIIPAVLLIHIFSGIYLYITDLKKPFSNAKQVAAFLIKNNLQNKAVYLTNFSAGPPVSAYLNQKLIYPETKSLDSYCKWNTWPFILTRTQLIQTLNNSVKNDSSVLIVNTFYLKNDLSNSLSDPSLNYRTIELASFENAMLEVENYKVYYLVKK